MSESAVPVERLEPIAIRCDHDGLTDLAAELHALIEQAREEGKPHYHGQCQQCGHEYTDLMMAHLHEEDHGHTVIEDYAPPATAGTEGSGLSAALELACQYIARDPTKEATDTLRHISALREGDKK